MAGTPIDGTSGWFVRLCKWLWKVLVFIWVMIFLSLGVGVVTTLLFTPWPWITNLKQTAIGWAFQNPIIVLLIFIVLLLLTSFVGLGSRFPGGISDKKAKRLYLDHMILSKKMLTLKGIPAG